MNQTRKIKIIPACLNSIISLQGLSFLLIFFLISPAAHAQEDGKPGSFGVHAGLNSGLLSGGVGPSLSLHYAIRTEKVLQFESMIFFDSHSGKTFLSGYSQRNFGFGLSTGIRINFLPQKNWNPSLAFLPGIMYSSESTSRQDDYGSSGISGAIGLSVSSLFHKKHMIIAGFTQGENISAAYIKYGFWF